jgi:starch phosphorylase
VPQLRDARHAPTSMVARTWLWQACCTTCRRGGLTPSALCVLESTNRVRGPSLIPAPAGIPATRGAEAPRNARVAYFSMEVALESDIPTYAGGLGVLAGDLLRSAADLGLAMVAVTLAHRRGYFRQHLDADGRQSAEPMIWAPEARVTKVDGRCEVEIEGRRVVVSAWRYDVRGVDGHVVPVLLLDTDLPDNDVDARRFTDELYGGDDRYRLCQEAVLGIGGVRMLRAVGYHDIRRFHLNEGHSALLALELYGETLAAAPHDAASAAERVRRSCVFTTHTPVPAGHDQFPVELVEKVLGSQSLDTLRTLGCCTDRLNLTLAALRLSHWVNGVARSHREVSSSMFPGYHIASISNGVHTATWTSRPFKRLYDRYIPDWHRSSFTLRYARSIPADAVAAAHREAKQLLIDAVNERAGTGFDIDVFTLGFARRATAYKRPTLLFHDPERLRKLAHDAEGLQIIFAGKAHPRDEVGQALIREVIRQAAALAPDVRVVWLENHDLGLAQLITSGVDVWLNTPRPPEEASGTSGMKAAHNGVPSLSVRDGWWWEGHIEGVTGWAVGAAHRDGPTAREDVEDAEAMYCLLEQRVIPAWRDPAQWADIMRETIAINASFFNTQRVLHEYVVRAYYGKE